MNRRTWPLYTGVGAGLGLLAGLLLVPRLMSVPPSLVVCLLCAALGAAAGVAALPFAEDGRSLVLHSGVHFAATSVLFGLLVLQFWTWADWGVLLLLEGMLALLYALIWLGRWIGWYLEVVQLRALLGLAPGPSPLKWQETLPYLPFVLLLCDGLPVALRWLERAVQGANLDIPVLSALILPFVLLPAGGFCAGLSLGKRQGLCPLFPAACFVCYLPVLFLVSTAELFHCFMAAVPALAGCLAGGLYRRAAEKARE